jgi:hypothetical protein
MVLPSTKDRTAKFNKLAVPILAHNTTRYRGHKISIFVVGYCA